MEEVLVRLGKYFVGYVVGWAACCSLWHLAFDLDRQGLLALTAVYVISGVVISRTEVEVLRVKLKESKVRREEEEELPPP